jgi:hypothetical protein
MSDESYQPMELPLIRRSAPTLLAHSISGVSPTRYQDLSDDDKAKWDAREKEADHRKANTIKLDFEVAPYGSHENSGHIYNVEGKETYFRWEDLRNRISVDDIDRYRIPVGKWTYDHHSIATHSPKFDDFLSNLEDGDELWLYDNNGFRVMAGRAGWLIIRDGKITHVYQKCMN